MVFMIHRIRFRVQGTAIRDPRATPGQAGMARPVALGRGGCPEGSGGTGGAIWEACPSPSGAIQKYIY